jgi:hypothetical protein
LGGIIEPSVAKRGAWKGVGRGVINDGTQIFFRCFSTKVGENQGGLLSRGHVNVAIT